MTKNSAPAWQPDTEGERAAGYLDGLDLDTPQPSANRSASYRHGFECARADRQRRPAFGSAQAAREKAAQAERRDQGA